MSTAARKLAHEVEELRTNIVRDLAGMLRDLESAKNAFDGVLAVKAGVSTLPVPQLYVLDYRDAALQSRIAIVRTVARLSENRMSFFTTAGEMITLLKDQIEGWEPVYQRQNEPLPDGWWR